MGDVIKLRDSDNATDFTQVLQGHVSQSVQQEFTEERTRVIMNKRLKLEAREHIVKDQFTNLYVVFTARLIDGEVYAVTTWVGSKNKGLNKRFLALTSKFDDTLLAYLQDGAFVAFGKATLAILKSRQAAKLPMVSALPSGMPAII